MRSFTRFSKGLYTALMLAVSGLGLGACGPDYALFKVDITSSKSPRNNIEDCRMTITDEKGVPVLDNYVLGTVAGDPNDTSGTLSQGCSGGITGQKIGRFSYSSSRTSGTLTFQVDAWDNHGLSCGWVTGDPPCVPVQSGSSGPIAPKAFPPEVPVTIVIN